MFDWIIQELFLFDRTVREWFIIIFPQLPENYSSIITSSKNDSLFKNDLYFINRSRMIHYHIEWIRSRTIHSPSNHITSIFYKLFIHHYTLQEQLIMIKSLENDSYFINRSRMIHCHIWWIRSWTFHSIFWVWATIQVRLNRLRTTHAWSNRSRTIHYHIGWIRSWTICSSPFFTKSFKNKEWLVFDWTIRELPMFDQIVREWFAITFPQLYRS